MTENRYEIQHLPAESRYVLLDREAGDAPAEIGQEAYVAFGSGDARQQIFYHTEVSEAYSGQGLASVLVRTAVEQAIASGYGIVPVCPYVAKWFEKHPEFSEHVVKARPEHITAVSER